MDFKKKIVLFFILRNKHLVPFEGENQIVIIGMEKKYEL
jgi:hypothetical protein